MTQVITFENFLPPPRYDSLPWTDYQIEESDLTTEPDIATVWTLIDSGTITPIDTDPTNPAARSFTTEVASDTVGLWYRLIFLDATGDDTLPTTPVQNLADIPTYASVHELARILKIRSPTTEQRAAMRRVLITATGEIDAEVDLAVTEELASWQLSLAAEVCLERAVEHWRQMESPFGLIGLGPEVPAERTARDSWDRHAHKLAPLKTQWGLA